MKLKQISFDAQSFPNLSDCHDLLSSIKSADVSHLIGQKGQLIEGQFSANETIVPFHWAYFPLASTQISLDLDPSLETVAEIMPKTLAQGLYYQSQRSTLISGMNEKLGFPGFGIGKNEADLIELAKSTGAFFISDMSNYPQLKGFFVIQDGRMLAYGPKNDPLPDGEYWILAKPKDETNLKPMRVACKGGSLLDIENIEFGFSGNPVVIGNKPVEDLFSFIPLCSESMAHNWRGGLAHLFLESIPPINKQMVDLIEKSDPDTTCIFDPLGEYLSEMATSSNTTDPLVAENVSKENIEDTFAWTQGFFKGREGTSPNTLKPGQYFFDEANKKFYWMPKRAVFGHTIFGLTNKGNFVVFKTFNTPLKDNGLQVEQLGQATLEMSRRFLPGETLQFAMVGANGGDVRSFVSGPNFTGFRNTLSDGTLLQQKLTGRSQRPNHVVFGPKT